MKFISLFTGIGGFDLGFERAGMECVAQVEINADCQKLLGDRWPNVKKYQDVRKVTGREQKSVDLICGGFPCQDLSVAGKRAGLDGERSGLWFEFHRIIANTLPRWVVIENVPGLLSSNEGKDFAVILRGLVECGYGVAWRILDAQYFGVAQRRRRVFIIGSLGDGRAAEILFEREGGTGDTPPRREAREDFARTVTAGANRSHHDHTQENLVTQGAVSTLRANAGSPKHEADNEKLVIARSQTSRNERNDGETENFIVAPTLNSSGAGTSRPGGQGAEPGFYIAFDWQQSADSNIEMTHTLNTTRTPAVSGRNPGVRRLTPVECERLQGFPDGWTEYCLQGGQCVIIVPCQNLHALYPDATDRLWTETKVSALCTTSESSDTEVSVFRPAQIKQKQNANFVSGYWGRMEQGECVLGTIRHGSDTVIRSSLKKIWMNVRGKQRDDPRTTNGWHPLLLEGPCNAERLSIISTWIVEMTNHLISMSASRAPSMEGFMILWNEPLPNFSNADSLCLKTASINRFSDSARYRMLGNAVAVPCAEWIGRRISE